MDHNRYDCANVWAGGVNEELLADANNVDKAENSRQMSTSILYECIR